MEKHLPELLLTWSDFAQSLEKLRHKTYTKNSAERDWFRINPLELLLLGCQTLSTGMSANREHGTMVLVMESIETPLRLRPRYWKRLLRVLIATCKEDISPFILQRCVTTIAGVWKSLVHFPEFQPSLYTWCVNEVAIISFVEWLIENKKDAIGQHQMSELTSLLGDIKGTLQESKDNFQLLMSGTREEEDVTSDLFPVFRRAVPDSTLEPIALQLLLMKRYNSTMPLSLTEESVKKLIDTLNTVSRDLLTCLYYLLDILQLLNIRQVDQAKGQAQSITSPKASEEEQHAEGDNTEITSPDDLFASLTIALTTWKSLNVTSSQDQEFNSGIFDISSQLLCLAHVILASGPLPETLAIATDFFTHTISVLMIYSTEGYLSNSPYKFFHELIEYVSSLVEQGIPPLTVVQTYLPNLFGPVFGTKNHSISCKLLEYGYLAACSQHQKLLLSEGLTFLVKVYHLFPPLDKARVELATKLRQFETLEIVNSLLDSIISSVVGMSNGEEREVVSADHFQNSGDTTDEVVVEDMESLIHSGKFLIEVTDDERESEGNIRLQILLCLLDLACAMVRNGDNVSFLFASTLPKLFSGSFPSCLKEKLHIDQTHYEKLFTCASNIPWQVDKKQFALHLLELATLSLENDIASPFHICGVVAPKLVQNIDSVVGLSNSEKMATTIEIMSITSDSIRNGQNITDLVSHGIDLLTLLIPDSTTPEAARKFIAQMTKQLVVFTHSSLLFMLKQSCHFMLKNFSEERLPIQVLIKTLIHRGKRDEIRAMFRLCRTEFESNRYKAVRQHLYLFSDGTLKHRQFIALSEILVAMMDVGKPSQVNRRTPGLEEESGESHKRNWEEIAVVLRKLTQPCLEKLVRSFSTDRFKQQDCEAISEEISKIALFRTLFDSEFSALTNLSETEVFQFFESKFPPDVLGDESLMHVLGVCGSRIEHMQVPRYSSLKALLSKFLQHFLSSNISPASEAGVHSAGVHKESMLKMRINLLDDYMLQFFPRNSKDKSKLIGFGYSSKLWDERLSLVVKTDGSHSLEENMRQALLACYQEFCHILQQMAITHVSVDGELVKSNELFDEQLSLTELKGRRAIVVRLIDSKLGKVREGYFHEKKTALLTKEDKIEEDFAKQEKAPVRPKTFTVCLNTRFFDCARCCGPQIIGCYAPNGEHCERPLEIGVRMDSAIASIYDETGLEMENAEILFTSEGAYLFKAYSNGHPYDTSQVWVKLFTALLTEPSTLVPAIIVPQSHPNQRTWGTIRRNIQPELTGGIITCEHDFSPEWRTYYDHRPEKVRNGLDIVLHPGFSLTSDSIRPGFRRQKSKMAKDLAGMMFDHVMHNMLQDVWWKHFRFLGKCVSQYLSEGVDTGELKRTVIENGLDHDRWKNSFLKTKNPSQVPFPFDDLSNPLPSKQLLVTALVDHVNASLRDWSDQTLSDVVHLCVNNHRQFLELKNLVEKSKGSLSFLKEKLPCIHECLKKCTFTVPLLSLPEALQEEIIHWVFRNEDRVWRYRGGRDGRETLHQFMCFLGRQHCTTQAAEEDKAVTGGNEKLFAGVVTFCIPHALNCVNLGNINQDFQVASMVGYAVGEILPDPSEDLHSTEDELSRWTPRAKDSCYEVVTAWTHPSYRGLNLGIQMYLDIAEQVPAKLVMCDMLEGSVERIIHSNRLLGLLENLHIISLILHSRQQSYSVLTPDGVTEQFEQVVFSVWPVRIAIKITRAARWMKRQRYASLLSVPPLTAVGLLVFRSWTH